MEKYELTVLVDKAEDLEEVRKAVKAVDGKIEKEDDWGQKTLAYPIKKKKSAHFFNFTLEFKDKSATDFKKKLDFSETLLRYLLLTA